MQNIEHQFLEAMTAAGLRPTKHSPIADSEIHRFHVDGDKSGSQNGWYVLHADNIPAGEFGSWKNGVSHTWCSKRPDDMTTGEREQLRLQTERARAERDRQRKAAHDAAAADCEKIWSDAATAVKHAYLDKKQVQSFGLKIFNRNVLLVPMRNINGELRSLQQIYPDGRKQFWKDGEVSGLYHPIGKPSGLIIVCEGYATGASIHQATGHSVAIAFNTSNLKPVADALAGKYPELEIIIAADDDRAVTQPVENPGVHYAKATGRRFVVPVFKNPVDALTDFNDLAVVEGAAAVKDQFDKFLAVPVAADNVVPIDIAKKRAELSEKIKTATIEQLDSEIKLEIINSGFSNIVQDSLLKEMASVMKGSVGELRKDIKSLRKQAGATTWRDSLSTNDESEPHPSLGNMALILRNDKAWSGVLAFDEFSLVILKKKKPPYGGKPGEWQDLDDYRTAMWLEEKYRMRAKSAVVNEAIQVIAHDNVFHPVQDYLNSLKWDGRPRVTKWLTNYIGADDKPYHRLVGKLWLVGAVARIFEPGCKMDNVLILEGAQGVGKSSALEILFSKKWYADSDIDFGSKDAILQMQGKWLIELAELSSFSRAESERVKGFFSRSQDTFRPPYGRAPMTVQRSCVFSGSANPSQYLKDETGNRRYWPVKSGEVKKDLLKRDKDQIWAEAVSLYRSGEEWWINGNMDIITEEQEQRYTGDAWEEMITEWLKKQEAIPYYDGVTTASIFTNCLEIEKGRWNKSDQMRIAGILKRLGYHRKKVHNSLTNCKEWKFVKQVLKVPT